MARVNYTPLDYHHFLVDCCGFKFALAVLMDYCNQKIKKMKMMVKKKKEIRNRKCNVNLSSDQRLNNHGWTLNINCG